MRENLYDDLFELEGVHWWHVNKRAIVMQLMRSHVKEKTPLILDVGCGTGKNVEVFSRMGECWGLDMSPRAIAFCKKRGLKRVRVGRAERSGLQKKFDVLTLLDVLEHVDDRAALKEMNRLLRPGGTLILTVPAFQWMWSNWDVALHHKRRYSKAQLEQILLSQGFSVKRISYVYMWLLIPVYIVRTIKKLYSDENSYRSDFQINSQLINSILTWVCSVERWLFDRINLPFGTSVICVARKEMKR